MGNCFCQVNNLGGPQPAAPVFLPHPFADAAQPVDDEPLARIHQVSLTRLTRLIQARPGPETAHQDLNLLVIAKYSDALLYSSGLIPQRRCATVCDRRLRQSPGPARTSSGRVATACVLCCRFLRFRTSTPGWGGPAAGEIGSELPQTRRGHIKGLPTH